MKPSTRRLLLSILLLAISSFSSSLWATSCSLGTSAVAFGNYNPVSPVADQANGSVTISCTPNCDLLIIFCITGWNGVDATIKLSTGGGTYLQRTMANGAQRLSYNLYLDTNYTTVFGNGSAGSSVVTYCFTGTGVSSCNGATFPGNPASNQSQNHTFTIYGKIPINQDVGVGPYSDTITVTATF